MHQQLLLTEAVHYFHHQYKTQDRCTTLRNHTWRLQLSRGATLTEPDAAPSVVQGYRHRSVSGWQTRQERNGTAAGEAASEAASGPWLVSTDGRGLVPQRPHQFQDDITAR